MRNARVAEAEAFRQRLAHQPDQQIDRFEIVVVDAADLFAPDRIVGQLLERLHRVLVNQPAELVVARHAAFAVAQDLDGREIEAFAVVARQVLQVLRIVVQAHRARVHQPERVELIGDVHLLEHLRAPRGLILPAAPTCRSRCCPCTERNVNSSGISGCMR